MIKIAITGVQGEGKTILAEKIRKIILSEGKTVVLIDDGGFADVKIDGGLDALIRTHLE